MLNYMICPTKDSYCQRNRAKSPSTLSTGDNGMGGKPETPSPPLQCSLTVPSKLFKMSFPDVHLTESSDLTYIRHIMQLCSQLWVYHVVTLSFSYNSSPFHIPESPSHMDFIHVGSVVLSIAFLGGQESDSFLFYQQQNWLATTQCVCFCTCMCTCVH